MTKQENSQSLSHQSIVKGFVNYDNDSCSVTFKNSMFELFLKDTQKKLKRHLRMDLLDEHLKEDSIFTINNLDRFYRICKDLKFSINYIPYSNIFTEFYKIAFQEEIIVEIYSLIET